MIIIFELILNFLTSTLFILILLLLVIAYHFILFFTRDTNYIEALKKNKNPEVLKLAELNDFPLVNVIIPAWKIQDLIEIISNFI